MQGLVLFGGKVGYRFIPKTACTSLKEKLFEMEFSDVYDDRIHNKHIHHFMKDNFSGDISNCEFKFMVVRDPIKRFLSAYSNRVGHHRELSEWYIREKHPELLGKIPCYDPDLASFIKYIELFMAVPSIRHHFKPISQFFNKSDFFSFDKIYKIENINDLESDLTKVYNKEFRLDKKQTEGVKLGVDALDFEQLSFLMDFYKDDYEILENYYSNEDIVNTWLDLTSKKGEHPFIIWTLRRCGGTNLGEALFKFSSYKAIQHEPFNSDRFFGWVTQDWIANKNRQSLENNIKSVLSSRPLIKHCFEIIPDELNLMLLKVSAELGYKHLFLYREFPTDRLLSLNYAQMTGVWGKGLESKVNESDLLSREIPVAKLLMHERDCRSKLFSIKDRMSEIDVTPLNLTFESLYKSDYAYSSALVEETFKYLGVDFEKVKGDFLRNILRSGGQGTKDKYLSFPNSSEFVAKSSKIERLMINPVPSFEIVYLEGCGSISHVNVWNVLPGFKCDVYNISGLVLPHNNSANLLSLRYSNGDEICLKTQLSSPKLEMEYPNVAGSAVARFLSYSFMLFSGDFLTLSINEKELVRIRRRDDLL